MTSSTRPLHELASGETARLRSELRLEIAQLETRMTMWMAIYAIGAVAVAIVFTMAFTLRGDAWLVVWLFILGTAGQLYCVWRMGHAIGRSP